MPQYYYVCRGCGSLFSAMTLNEMVARDLPCQCGEFPTFRTAREVVNPDPIYAQESETPLWQVQHAYDNRIHG